MENAVKIARLATRRSAVVVFDHAYHGRTNLTMALTAKAMPYKKGFGPFAGEIYRMPMSYPFRDVEGMTGKDAAARAISMIEKQIGADEVAAVLIEPVQGEGGFIVPADGFLPALSEWCSQHGVVFIADEIQSGFCRTGSWFACDHEGVVPDLVTTAKGIAGGLPLAAVTGRAELMDAVHAGGLGGTYGGNPIACAAALAAIETMEELDLNGAARRIEALVVPRMRALAAETGRIGDVRGRGAMIALEFTVAGSLEPDPAAATAVAKACHAAGRGDPDLRHLRQRHPVAAAAGHRRTSCCPRAWTCWRRRSGRCEQLDRPGRASRAGQARRGRPASGDLGWRGDPFPRCPVGGAAAGASSPTEGSSSRGPPTWQRRSSPSSSA